MTSAPGVWTTGPVFTPARADFALSYYNNKLYAIGGDTTGGGYFDFSTLVDELDISAWPAGGWAPSPPFLPSARQANQAGFYNSGPPARIWTTGGYNGAALAEHLYRQYDVICTTPTATPAVTATATPTATATSTPCPLGRNYTITNGAAAIVPGTTDIGNHCDDCATASPCPSRSPSTAPPTTPPPPAPTATWPSAPPITSSTPAACPTPPRPTTSSPSRSTRSPARPATMASSP